MPEYCRLQEEASKRSPYCQKAHTVGEPSQAKDTIIQTTQEDVYTEKLFHIKDGEELPKNSNFKGLSPFIDGHSLLRIGGCINMAEIGSDKKHLIIIPDKYHIELLLVRHYHEQTRHQERLLTEGAILDSWQQEVCEPIHSPLCYLSKTTRPYPNTEDG